MPPHAAAQIYKRESTLSALPFVVFFAATRIFWKRLEFFARACYNGYMVIRKRAGVALAALLALSAAGAAFPLYENTSASADESAVRASSVALTTDNASLFLPVSYEEYLPLENPSDVAFSENYIAIADGMNLYVYARENGSEYKLYTLSSGNIAKIGFHGDDLYFVVRDSDASIRFYRYDYATGSARDMGFNCSTFLIVGDTLYSATVAGSSTTFAARTLTADGAGEAQTLGELSTSTEPYLAYAGGTLYCCVNDRIYTPRADTAKFHADRPGEYLGQSAQTANVTSVCSDGTSLYFSSTAGLYRRGTGSDGTVTRLSDASGLSDMSFHGSALYCIEAKSVREITVADDSAPSTSYEITSASDSENRLSGATDMARAGNLLRTANAGKSRVSVYNFQTQSYSVIPCAEAPSIVATDGETIAYASGTNIYTCAYGDTQFTQADLDSALLQDISGLTCVYGTVYYVTENGMRGSVGGTMVSSTGAPTGLATDLYGNLYVTYSGGTEARKFTEAEFTAAGAEGAGTGVTVPGGATSLEADYQGNLYYLSGGVLYRNGEPFATVSCSDFIWTQDGSAQNAVSFALGFEDDEVYFNFGNYLVKSNAGTLADIPTLSEIAVGGARDETFAHHAEDRLLVTVPAGTVGISTDLTALRDEGGETFPYRSYARAAEERQGVFLAETDGWSLVLFAEGDGTYTAGLYPSSSLAFTDASEYYTASEPTLTRYVSSSVSVYYAPCLESALAQRQLPRGTQVTLIGTVQTAEFTYALVEFSDDARTTARGYVPASYLTSIPADLSLGENYTLVYLKSSDEGILFTAADGSELLVTERVQVRLYDNGDGTYTARLADDLSYSATITDDMIDDGNAEVIRIVLIVILTVLALVILGVYLYLLPWEKYRKNKK